MRLLFMLLLLGSGLFCQSQTLHDFVPGEAEKSKSMINKTVMATDARNDLTMQSDSTPWYSADIQFLGMIRHDYLFDSSGQLIKRIVNAPGSSTETWYFKGSHIIKAVLNDLKENRIREYYFSKKENELNYNQLVDLKLRYPQLKPYFGVLVELNYPSELSKFFNSDK